MNIKASQIKSLLDSDMHELERIKNFDKAMPLSGGSLTITLDDRGDVHLYENNLARFFTNFQERCSCLTQALGLNFVDFLEPLVDLINGDTDEISTYHHSIYPIKTPFNLEKMGRFTLVQLDETTFESYRAAHQALSHEVTDENYPEGYRLLLVSEERAKRVSIHQHHKFFDRLDEIYTNHGLIVHLLQHYSGTKYRNTGSWATDNFPDASASGSPKMQKMEINSISSNDLETIGRILAALDPAVFYRLLLRSEIYSKGNFQKLIFLRSLLDPILKKYDRKITAQANQLLHDKTEVQANFILKILTSNSSRLAHAPKKSEIIEFLKIRNAIIHPSPTDDIERLHILFDKLNDFRILVYEVIFKTLTKNSVQQEDLFTVAV